MNSNSEQPTLLVFAGPNGSGKSTVTRSLPPVGVYINADDIKAEYGLSDLEAAQQAEALRNQMLSKELDFSFETVLSTERNLFLVKRAKEAGYYVYGIYVLTDNPEINISRVRGRVANGGHDVPEDKIRTRYYRALTLIPKLYQLCDELLIYDNSNVPNLIFSKTEKGDEISPTELWSEERIKELLST